MGNYFLFYIFAKFYHLFNWEVGGGEEITLPPQPYKKMMADAFNHKKQSCWKSAQSLSMVSALLE